MRSRLLFQMLPDCFLLNGVLAFVLMGLQARPFIERLSPEQRWGSLVFGLTVLALVIVVRMAHLAVYRATRWVTAPQRRAVSWPY